MPTHTLRSVLNYLLLNGYLDTTEDEYSIVKLTEKSQAVSAGKENILMKLPKETDLERLTGQQKGKNKKQKHGIGGAAQGSSLFESLRALRSQIAREEKVPPYIVFSDKTLEHMCVVRPRNKDEMLTVTGVGAYKFEKYGEQFLSVIREAEQ